MVVKGPTEQMATSFRMEDKGPVMSIKFSPDQQVLAIQRTKTSVVVIFILFPFSGRGGGRLISRNWLLVTTAV